MRVSSNSISFSNSGSLTSTSSFSASRAVISSFLSFSCSSICSFPFSLSRAIILSLFSFSCLSLSLTSIAINFSFSFFFLSSSFIFSSLSFSPPPFPFSASKAIILSLSFSASISRSLATSFFIVLISSLFKNFNFSSPSSDIVFFNWFSRELNCFSLFSFWIPFFSSGIMFIII